MKKIWIIFVVLFLLLLGLYFAIGGKVANNGGESDEVTLVDRSGGPGSEGKKSFIDADYGTKIVYTTEANLDTHPLIEDCSARGGTFKECGSPCPPEAEACVSVCAYTCDNIK